MAVVTSLAQAGKESIKENRMTGSYSLSDIVLDVTKEILYESPELVVNAHYDRQSKIFLENRIQKMLDRREYFELGSKRKMIKDIFDFMFNYGQLQQYIDDEEISDIDGVAYNMFSITKNGVRMPVDISFSNQSNFDVYCRLIALRNGGILNENDSHCRVADIDNRLRINISIHPRNISGSAISVRKHRKNAYSLNDLMHLGMLDEKCMSVLTGLACSLRTFVVCGKGGSGKTTLVRALLNILPEMERVLIVESDAELYPDKSYCISQRVKRDNEGGNPVTLDMLIKDGLTMSLDTYCIGEIVGAEAMAFLNACCSGHRFITTIHSNSAYDCAARMVALAKGAGGISDEKMLTRMFCDGVYAIVFMDKFTVQHITYLDGYDYSSNLIKYRTAYTREEKDQPTAVQSEEK